MVQPLFPIVVLLAAGILGLVVAHAFHFSPIIGFFLLGGLIGGHGFGLIDLHTPGLHFLAELGVCFLLFDVGLHLSIKELKADWRSFALLGSAQFVSVTLLIAAVLFAIGRPVSEAFTIGAIFSLSSTALVLKLLADEREQSSPVGRYATHVLVLQDIIAITLLVFFARPMGEQLTFSTAIFPLVKMIAAAALMISFGRVALKPLFRGLVAVKNDEVFTAVALLIVFVTSGITEYLGLSLALGAFLGGLALSESSYSYLVRSEVAPFRSLLLSLFFLSIGMGFDVAGIMQNAALFSLLLVLFIAVKAGGNWLAFAVSGIPRPQATLLSFLLAQGSEFAFVLIGAATVAGLLPADIGSMAIAIIGLSLATTPLVAGMGCYWSRSVCHVEHEQDVLEHEPPEVVIVELDEFGREIAGYLAEAGVAYRGHDRDLERLTFAKSRGLNVFYSDINRPRTLSRASTGHVLAVISGVEDDSVSRLLIEGMKKIAPHVPLIAATRDPQRFEALVHLGVENVFVKSRDAIPALLESLFEQLNLKNSTSSEIISRARTELATKSFPRTAFEPALAA